MLRFNCKCSLFLSLMMEVHLICSFAHIGFAKHRPLSKSVLSQSQEAYCKTLELQLTQKPKKTPKQNKISAVIKGEYKAVGFRQVPPRAHNSQGSRLFGMKDYLSGTSGITSWVKPLENQITIVDDDLRRVVSYSATKKCLEHNPSLTSLVSKLDVLIVWERPQGKLFFCKKQKIVSGELKSYLEYFTIPTGQQEPLAVGLFLLDKPSENLYFNPDLMQEIYLTSFTKTTGLAVVVAYKTGYDEKQLFLLDLGTAKSRPLLFPESYDPSSKILITNRDDAFYVKVSPESPIMKIWN